MCGGGPFEGARVGIVVLDETLDFVHQFFDIGERAATDGFLGLDATSTQLRFGLDELQATFDELYDGAWQEIFSRSRFSNKELKRVEEVAVC